MSCVECSAPSRTDECFIEDRAIPSTCFRCDKPFCSEHSYLQIDGEWGVVSLYAVECHDCVWEKQFHVRFLRWLQSWF